MYTRKVRDDFAAILAATLNVSQACRAIGISLACAYQWRKKHPDFAEAWDSAVREAVHEAEGELMRRGVHGVDEPVYQGGKLVGTVRRYSDSLLQFLVKAHDARYKDRQSIDLVGVVGGVNLESPEVAERLSALHAAAVARLAQQVPSPAPEADRAPEPEVMALPGPSALDDLL